MLPDKRQNEFFRRVICVPVLIAFISLSLLPAPGWARGLPQTDLNLPAPGSMVEFSKAFDPVHMQGLKIDPEQPLRFEFIVTPGDTHFTTKELEGETEKVVKYFFAALTIPEDDMWVNLSPYERQRTITQEFAQTGMGRDLLAQDYLLKQVTASVMYPEKDLGRAFWQRVFHRAQQEFGTTDIPVDTFNKVWIVPQTAVVHVEGNSAYVLESKLDVMLEEDYLARQQNKIAPAQQEEDNSEARELTQTIMREIILPEIREEINSGENFATLRQIYQTLILAQWFKLHLRQTLVGEVYVDRKRVAGVDIADKAAKEKIYDQYLEAFKKGVYNLIREDADSAGNPMPRQYFSGGAQLGRHLTRVYQEVTDPVRFAAVTQGYIDEAMVATVDLTPNRQFPVDDAMFAEMQSRWEETPELSIGDLAVELGTTTDDPEFRGALHQRIKETPKAILHEHASGLIFAENMIEYLLDDVEDNPDDFEPEEIDIRREKRREARRRFVLTHDSTRSYLALQREGVDPSEIDQETADRRFREIFNMDADAPLSINSVEPESFVERLRSFTTQNPDDEAQEFERSFTFIKAVTDAHRSFRFELIRRGILQQHREDNVQDFEITVYHDWDHLEEFMEQVRQAEVEVEREGGSLNVSVLKGFRKDHYHNILKEVSRDPAKAEHYMSMFDGLTLGETKDAILRRVIELDGTHLDVPAKTVEKEFREAFEEIVRQTKRVQEARGEELTPEHIRQRLVLAYFARLHAVAEVYEFQHRLNKFENRHPRYAKRIGGISSIGEEIQVIDGVAIGYLNWTESPIFRKARMMGYKRSVHVGEIWSPGQYADGLRRIKQLLDIGVERLAHVTILGLDYDRIPSELIADRERDRAKFLQEQIFELLRKKGTHVELQPTSQMINAPIYRKFHKYENHVAGMFLANELNFSINPDDSSVYNTNPTREIFEIAISNPEITAEQLDGLYHGARRSRFYQNPEELIEDLAMERRMVHWAQEAFQLAAIVVFGSARIPDGHPQQYVAEELGRLIFEMGLAIRTGGGPSAMKWPFISFIDAREQYLEKVREDFEGTQSEWEEFADGVRRVSATQSIRILLNFWEPASKYGENRHDFYHFAFRKMGLHLKAKRVISLHGGVGTWDEILETWRRDRDLVLVGKGFWEPVLEAVRTSWEEGGFMDQVRTWPKIVETAQEALEGVLPDEENGGLEYTDAKATELAVEEMSAGIRVLSQLPNAVTIVGKPNTNGFSQRYLDKLEALVRDLVEEGAYIRVASRGPVFSTVRRVMVELGQEERLQAVLFRHHNDVTWNQEELTFKDNYPNNSVFVHEDSIHQILTTYGSRGYVILPGALGTFNKAFDIVGAMQTKTIRVKPMAFMGNTFYGRIKTALIEATEGHNPPTVSEGDWELVKVIEEAPTGMLVLGFVQPQIPDLAMMSSVDDQIAALPAVIVAEPAQDEALTVATKKDSDAVGGIDLTPVDIRIQGDGQPLTLPIEGVDTYMYDNINGFTPIIVRIEPLHDPNILLHAATTAN